MPRVIEPHRPALDQRTYALQTLENGLQVLLISDPEQDQSGAALATVGAVKEPADRPGLAHFLEHMLFLGTRSFPDADSFAKKIVENGGYHNAFTSQNHTVYLFTVNPSALKSSLHHFSTLFTEPLLDQRYVERERLAVESEFRLRHSRDVLRMLDATRAVMNPKNNWSRFFAGNEMTLSDRQGHSIADELRAFFEQYYRGNHMVLVVAGTETVEELSQWVQRDFSSIPGALTTQTQEPHEPLFDVKKLPSELRIRSKGSLQRLDLIHPVPSEHGNWPFSPLYLLAGLLGHEGKGSVYEALYRKGLITSLWTSYSEYDEHTSMFSLSMLLTDEGTRRVDEIVAHVYAYLKIMRRSPEILKRSHQEQKRINYVNFHYAERTDLFHELSQMARNFNRYPSEELLRGTYRQDDYNQKVVNEYLKQFAPEKMLVRLTTPDGEFDQRSRWLNAEMRLRRISQERLDQWEAESEPIAETLHLPSPNTFIPYVYQEVFSPHVAERPRLLDSRSALEVWHCSDTTFGTVKSVFYASMLSNLPQQGVKSQVLNALYADMLAMQLRPVGYDAAIAGTFNLLRGHMRGWTLELQGFNPMLPRVLHHATQAMAQESLDARSFELAKQKLLRGYTQEMYQPLHKQALAHVLTTLHSGTWPYESKMHVLQNLTLMDLHDYVWRFKRSAKLVVFACGHLEPDTTLEMGLSMRARLIQRHSHERIALPKLAALKPDEPVVAIKNAALPDYALAWYIQSSAKNAQGLAALTMLQKLLEADFFHSLRTEQQLGYVVRLSAYPILRFPALMMIVESPSADFEQIHAAMKRYLQQVPNVLQDISLEDYERMRNNAILEQEAEDLRLGQRARRYWRQIHTIDHNFAEKEQVIEELRKLSLEQLKEYVQRNLLADRLRELVVLASAQPNPIWTANGKRLEEANALERFKKTAHYHD